MDDTTKGKTPHRPDYMIFGLLIGTMLGVVLDNIGLWMPLGLCAGAVIEAIRNRKKKGNNNNEPDKE